MKTVTLGLAGTGRIGTMHARNIAALNEGLADRGLRIRLQLTDVAADHARRVAEALGAEFVPSAAQMLDGGVDGLVIATGTATHPELIRAGVGAGVPVFCEKPVAGDVADSLPVLDYIRDRQGVVQIGHQRRFDAGYLEAKRRLDAGAGSTPSGLLPATCSRPRSTSWQPPAGCSVTARCMTSIFSAG